MMISSANGKQSEKNLILNIKKVKNSLSFFNFFEKCIKICRVGRVNRVSRVAPIKPFLGLSLSLIIAHYGVVPKFGLPVV